MKKNNDGTYVPGVIYHLGVYMDDVFTPFYVGETTNADTRLKQHKYNMKANKEYLVYDMMRQLLDMNIHTHMELVDSYGTEGPGDLEDEHIMKLLLQDIKLENQKKGSAAWMTKMTDTCNRMKKTGYTSLRKFKVWDAEQKRIENEERHAQRIEDSKRYNFKTNKIEYIPDTQPRRVKYKSYKARAPETPDEIVARLKRQQASTVKTESIINQIKRK